MADTTTNNTMLTTTTASVTAVVGENNDHHHNKWKVHKFGGTSVADAHCFQSVAQIIEDDLFGKSKININNNTAKLEKL